MNIYEYFFQKLIVKSAESSCLKKHTKKYDSLWLKKD
ncbi:hypothetical protein QF004_002667 [Chryseobacterium sp. MDT2-18]|nr:hypothetical protein [Chryseobacterium sp. MDT2-18]